MPQALLQLYTCYNSLSTESDDERERATSKTVAKIEILDGAVGNGRRSLKDFDLSSRGRRPFMRRPFINGLLLVYIAHGSLIDISEHYVHTGVCRIFATHA